MTIYPHLGGAQCLHQAYPCQQVEKFLLLSSDVTIEAGKV